ncbi:MAG TPA: FkbM family methyltransferase [Solirubrobacteraceae bacterium]|jgi:FkbM family methyltransferase|nr:FkbM family methyltransferase [Solirubrobacteraceae bacterium]
MPSTRVQRARTYIRASAPWRRLMPHRTVRRSVQGVELYMPWAHLLPDYARSDPAYGQNLVELAAALTAHDEPGSVLRMLDVGANIGDSSAQVIARTGAEVLCVEADPYWVRYLQLNLGDEPRATIVEALLVGERADWEASAPVRARGTTTFVQDAGRPGALPSVTIADLRAANPAFENLRLVKSDTDGFDAILVPAIASTWRDAGPVLFFEWDPALTRRADARDPDLIWTKLAELGYARLALWDNGGAPLGQIDIGDAAAASRTLALGSRKLGYSFWDVAAWRADDAAAAAAIGQLVPGAFSVPAAALSG